MSKKRVIILSGALLCFAFIGFMVMHSMQTGKALAFDTAVRGVILGWRNDFLNPILTWITYWGNSNTITFFCLVMLLIPKIRHTYGLPLTLTTICSASLQTLMKGMIQRPRPPVDSFLISQGGFSFPSGHSCTGLVFYGLLAYLLLFTGVDKSVNKFLAGASIVLFLLIGFSRVYVGVHYPTDVLGGWSLGLVILMVAITCIEKTGLGREEKSEI